METVYIAGGCLWGVQAFIKTLPGVLSTERDVQMEYLKHLVTNMTAMQNVSKRHSTLCRHQLLT